MGDQEKIKTVLYKKVLGFRNRAWRFAALNPAFLLASGFALVSALAGTGTLEPLPGADMERTFSVKAVISSLPEKTSYGYRFRLQPISISQDENELKFRDKIILTLPFHGGQEKDPGSLFMGDTLDFRGTFSRPSYNLLPGSQDRRITAAMEGTPFSIRLKSTRQIREITPPSLPEYYLFKYLQNFILFVEDSCSESMGFLIRALALGQKNAMPVQVREKLNRLGVTHLFVISGFHIGVVALLLHFLFGRRRSAGALLAISIIIWIYVWVIGFSIPASRAAVIVSIFLLLTYWGIQKNLLNSLGIAALVIMVINPRVVFLPGFQLTFSCLLAIIWLVVPLMRFMDSPLKGYRAFLENRVSTDLSREESLARLCRTRFEEYLRHLPGTARKAGLFFLILLSWPVKAMGCTAGIQFFLFPVLVFYFNTFNFFSLAATAFFIPLISILVLIGILLLALWWSPLSPLLCQAYEFMGETTLSMLDILDSMFKPVYLPHPGVTLVLIYYAFLLLMLVLNPSRGWVLPLLILAAFFSWSRIIPPETDRNVLEISMLDVGQGDCFHLRLPDGSSGLIDAGGTIYQDNELFIGKNLISRYLWDSGVKELEYILITHPEKDHNAGHRFLGEAFQINNFYYHDSPGTYPPDSRQLSAGDSFVTGGVFHQVLWPERDFGRKDNLNDRSLVVLLTYGRFRMLFTGDISDKIEKKLIRKYDLAGIPVLKASHHGSNSSSCREFLETLQAETAVISAGRRNPFGHPSIHVVKRITEAGMDIYSTPEHGTITIITDGMSWKIEKQAEQR